MAITKERLEELIEQEAIVYYFDINNVVAFHLDNSISIKGEQVQFLEKGIEMQIWIGHLYEHQSDTIHASKYVNMPSGATLSLPFWSDIIENECELDILFVRDYALRFFIGVNGLGKYTDIQIFNGTEIYWSKPLTQENYAEACEIIKNIWEGKQ